MNAVNSLAHGWACVALVLSGSFLGIAQAADSAGLAAASAGRIEFDHGGGPANVEVDLPADLFTNAAGLGDAALAGVTQGLLRGAGDKADSADVKIAAEHLAAIRQMLGSLKGAVSEVRVRLYQGSHGSAGAHGEDQSPAVSLGGVSQHYAEKLQGTSWSKIVRAQQDNKSATVYLLQNDGAIRGVFVVAGEGDKLALVNVVCDVSPQRVQQLAEQATAAGLKIGGDEALAQFLIELRGKHDRRDPNPGH